MKIALLFAGQGVQSVGMCKHLVNESAFNEVFSHLDKDTQKICLEGPVERLNDTKYAQPCIVATSLGIANILKKHHLKIDYVAGLSLGEYSALAYSGAIHIDDCLKIVGIRGKIMADALNHLHTGMVAVLNCPLDRLHVLLQPYNLTIANYNSPKQIVVSGDIESLTQFVDDCKQEKIRAIFLNVSGAFHSAYLKEASVRLKETLTKYVFKQPEIPVVFNVVGETSQNDLIDLLTQQICSPVRFMQSIQWMIQQGVDTFIEIGPGKVLSSFVKQIDDQVKVYQVDSVESIERVVKSINE